MGKYTKYLINRITSITIAAASPSLPMFSARSPSFTCSGVSSLSVRKPIMVFPLKEFSPTAITIICPKPSNTLVPDSRNGSSESPFLMASLSPVIPLSSHLMLCPSKNTPSAHRMSPVSTYTISPTTISTTLTCICVPERRTLIS
eukprot:Lithocolla_globosa_v1_NODE_856_length_3177_cov_20.386611.p2 type:complete len:145 gc:universal NODE_856_length_3177_cov_20.386611:2143-2577(+)